MDKEEKKMPDILKTLTLEELAKVKPLTVEEIEAALEKGRKEKELFEKYLPSIISSNIYYK